MSRYLEGNFAPVTEEITAFDLPVIGELPSDLEGRYLRNGPNPVRAVAPDTHHWFMGDGMVHGVRLRGGRAEWYRNRYVGSTSLSAARGVPDIPGRNWNNSPGGPNTNVGTFAGVLRPLWQVTQVTTVRPPNALALMSRIIVIIWRAVSFGASPSFARSFSSWQYSHVTPRSRAMSRMIGVT